VLGQAAEEFLLNPGFLEGLARQIEEQANQQAQLVREMGGGDLDQALDDSLQSIRGIHGDRIFDLAVEYVNDVTRGMDLTEEPERFIQAIRDEADSHAGAFHSALTNLADDLESAHLGNWEAEEGLQLPVPELPPHERPLQPFAPRGNDPIAYRDYYTSEATGATRGFDHVMQAERITPGAIREAIARTDGAAMYDPDIQQFYGVDSPAGVSQINHALRRYIEGRDVEPAQLPAPAARPADDLPPVRQIPMGQNFLSEAVDEMLDSDHVDNLMEVYERIGDEVNDLSDRTNQPRILNLIRELSDEWEDLGELDVAADIRRLAEIFRDSIFDAARPEGHATGGLIQSFSGGGQPETMSEFDKALSQPGLKHKFTEQDLLRNYGDSVFESFDKAKARKRLEPVALNHATYVENFDDGVSLLRRNSVPLGKATPEAEPSGKSMEDYNRQHMPLLEKEQTMRRGTPVYKKGGAAAHKPVYFAETPDAMRYELLRNK
jgi:hypothetical protein